MTDPVEKTVVVPVSPKRAFERFTAEMGRWWPGDKHSVSAGQNARPLAIEMDTRSGGEVRETLPDGTVTVWGRILRWDPPSGFAMTWHPGSSGDQATHLELRFAAHETGTQVTLIHSGWDVLADRAGDIQAHYSSGWDHVIGTCYRNAFD